MTEHPGPKLLAMRRRAHLSQPVAAHASGISRSQLSRIEHGHHWPRGSTLRRLIVCYGTHIRSLEAIAPQWKGTD